MPKQELLQRRLVSLVAVAALFVSALLPLATTERVDALELINRKVTIDKGNAGATDVTFTFQFNLPTAQARQGLRYQFCTTPLDTCTAPTGMNLGGDTVTHDGQTGWPTNSAVWSQVSGDIGACQETTNAIYEICFTRTDAVNNTVNDTVTHTISGITAPSSVDTVYVRITIYNDTAFSQPASPDRGVVAAAFTNQLTVSATVSEYLEFCVGSQDAGAQDNCTDISGTTINLGTVPFSGVCFSGAVNPCENDDGREGYAMVATNAANGVVVNYYAEQDATNTNTNKDGSLKIQGADCTVTVGDATDECFESAGVMPINFTAGIENFGMTVRAVDTSNGGLTTNLTRDAAYDGDGVADAEGCTGLGAVDEDCWAWDESGAVQQIASSSSVVDDEMLIIDFAAAAALTTPTGTYSVVSNYIATPTF